MDSQQKKGLPFTQETSTQRVRIAQSRPIHDKGPPDEQLNLGPR